MGKHELVVASVPAGHAYLTNLGLADAGIGVLPDPPVPGAPPGRWWPPRMLDPEWIAAHAGDFSLLHVHFGMESFTLAELGAALDALRAAGRPLVHTVHDLSHPQLADDAHHRAQLELVVRAADRLITLTPGAAAEIANRFGRRAAVIPHPAMRTGPPFRIDAAPCDRDPPVVGVHLRDLRPGIDGPGTVAALDGALARVRAVGPAATGRVWMHATVRDAAAGARVRALCAASDRLTLVVAPRSGDAVLEAELAGLAVSVLPYRHGTHSGWLELCWDLGVPVAVPDRGHVAEQHPDPGFRRVYAPGSAASLAGALLALLAVPEAVPGGPARAQTCRRRVADRVRERPALAAAHLAVYRAALG